MKTLFVGASTACLLLAGQAISQDFPHSPITLIVPVAPGGPTDTIARVIAQNMRFDEPVIVENRPGGGGIVAGDTVSRARPDGYTITIGLLGTHVLNAAIADLQYDVVEDFTPIALVAESPQFIVSNPEVPAQTLEELIAWMKDNDRTTLGTPGVGSAAHVSSVDFSNRAGVQSEIVHYRGGALAKQDLIAGNIDMMIDLAGNSLPQIKSGDLRAYAVTSPERLAAAPDVPTTAEAGLPDFEVSVWHGIWAPKDTPEPIVAALNEAIGAALDSPDVQRIYDSNAQNIPAAEDRTPAALAELQKAEIERWFPIIEAAGISNQ